MSVHAWKRFAGIACVAVWGMSGCSLMPAGGPTDVVNGLEYLGEGRKIEYQRMIEEAGGKNSEKADVLVAQAQRENALVGEPLSVVGEGTGSIAFAEDGTISGDEEALKKFDMPTHWQVGVSKFRMCWAQECEFYSSWSIESSENSDGGVDYTLNLEGLDEQEGPVVVKLTRAS
ncbi:MAG: hypothetical protein CSA82_01740 [Actinobacteria bacterium]|nr:MAG: hypothetical protein CSA82_01740 [Actinomycetota bacterium]